MEGVTEQLHNSIGSEELGPVYQDGGVPTAGGLARQIDKENWRYYWDMLLDEFFLTQEGSDKSVNSKD